MLVHICCSVDSDYFIKKLRQTYPNEPLLAYFYDPNIHPYSEYLLRFSDVERSCKKLGVPLICGEYDYESWLSGTKGLENEPEKGKRCEYCFDFRVNQSAKKAIELGESTITTTLLMSPKKNFNQLENSLKSVSERYGLKYLAIDFRKGGGTSEQFNNAKKEKLYHQNYCGCLYALNAQRSQNEAWELISPLGAQTQPASIKSRLKLYKKVRKCEKLKQDYELNRVKILNYRLKNARLSFDGVVMDSYFLFYSYINKGFTRFNAIENKNIFYGKDEVWLVSLKHFNHLANFNYKSVRELIYSPPKLKAELHIRKKLCGKNSLNPIIILDKILSAKCEIQIDSVLFHSSVEKLKVKNHKF